MVIYVLKMDTRYQPVIERVVQQRKTRQYGPTGGSHGDTLAEVISLMEVKHDNPYPSTPVK
jgi:hypothetical protein